MPGPFITQTSESLPFNNESNGFTADTAQGAIEEVSAAAKGGASPGFCWGRSGNVNAGAFLLNETVPSNLTGRAVLLTGAAITNISVSNSAVNTFTVKIEEHDGVTHTLLTTVTVTAARSGVFAVNIPVTTGKQLAVYIGSGSAQNPVVLLVMKGSIA